MSRVQVFLSSVYASRLSSPCPLVIAYISSWGGGRQEKYS